MTLIMANTERFAAAMSDDLSGPLENPVTFRRSAQPIPPPPALAAPEPAAPAQAAPALSADDFVAEFAKDDAAFKKHFDSKKLTLEGKVREAKVREEKGFTYVSIVLAGKNQPEKKEPNIICNFPSAMAGEIRKFKSGVIVRLTGDLMSESKYMGEISVSGCSEVRIVP